MKYTRLVKPKSCSKQVRVFGSKVKQMTRVRKYTQHDYHITVAKVEIGESLQDGKVKKLRPTSKVVHVTLAYFRPLKLLPLWSNAFLIGWTHLYWMTWVFYEVTVHRWTQHTCKAHITERPLCTTQRSRVATATSCHRDVLFYKSLSPYSAVEKDV